MFLKCFMNCFLFLLCFSKQERFKVFFSSLKLKTFVLTLKISIIHLFYNNYNVKTIKIFVFLKESDFQ